MASQMTIERFRQMKGHPLYDREHNKLGGIEEIFLDEVTNEPEWIAVSMGGMLGGGTHVVPVDGLEPEGDGLRAPFTKEQISSTPKIDTDEITRETERELYRAYGMEPSERRSPSVMGQSGTAGPADESGGDLDIDEQGTMTRTEEELRVGKRETDAGRVRLRKWVETEPASADVELRRETASVERRPINRPASEADIGDEELTAELHEERPVVGKEAVAKEEVGLRKGEERRREEVTGEVRKERIEAEEEGEHDPGFHRER